MTAHLMRSKTFQNAVAVVLAISLHVAVGSILLLNFDTPNVSRSPVVSTPEIVQAVVVDATQFNAAIEARRQEEEAKHRAEEEARRLAEETKRQAEAEAKRKAAEEAKRKAAKEAKRQAEAEAKRKAAKEAKRQAEAEAKRKAAEEARRQLLESLERERRNRFIQGQVEQYASLIKAQVEQHWRLPQGSRNGLSCLLKITLTPEGSVLDVSVVQSSGDPTFDQSAIAAVYRASPLPLPSAPEAMAVFRSFNFKFYPGG